MPYILTLATSQGELQATPSASLRRAETEQFTPLQLSLQLFLFIVNLRCKLALNERATTNEIRRELEQKQGGEGAAELLSASLISRRCLSQL